MSRAVFTSTALPLAFAVACGPATGSSPPDIHADTVAPSSLLSQQVHGVIDEDADPCVDFFQYACGQWLEETEIPADQSRFGRFNVLSDSNLAVLREILEAAVTQANPDPDTARLAAMYGSCMDEASVEADGARGLSPLLDSVERITDAASLMTALGTLHRAGAGVLFQFAVAPDYDQPDTNIVHLGQGGLGLPDRDYYLREGEEAELLRSAYAAHIATMLSLLELPEPEAQARRIVAFETQLAAASSPREELRDPTKLHNELGPQGLAALTPALPWQHFFAAVGHGAVPGVANVSPEPFVAAVSEMVGAAVGPGGDPARLQLIKEYLRWQVVHASANFLPAAFVKADFEFFSRRLRGQSELTPRWKRCVALTDRAIGESLAQGYVERKFSGDSKEIAISMIRAIEDAFASGLQELSWMDAATRGRALDKMHAIVNKVGFPDRWRDYSAMRLGNGLLANVRAAAEFESDRVVARIGEPVDRREWHMTPPTVNAYYNPSSNEMVFPAGILQRPFFDADYPMAMNFGGIGMVMGHELTHGFDDQGRKFDGDGKLAQWWDPAAVTRFEERTQCVVDLYDTFEVEPGVSLNGQLTLGENIADFGGIKDAFRAWRRYAEGHAAALDTGVQGLTADQLFFVSFGQIWCSKATPQAARVLALTDPHSAARFRVNGPLANLPEFWDTFSCEPGEPMRPADVCEVW